MEEKLERYEEANKQVAILCNHQKTVGKKFVESLNKKEQFIEHLKTYLKDLEKHKAQFTAKRENIKKADEAIEIEGLKPYIKKFPDTKDATTTAIKKLQ
jgi:DNA topoisomerase I